LLKGFSGNAICKTKAGRTAENREETRHNFADESSLHIDTDFGQLWLSDKPL
jgi:hypothetical protein